jgi:hypothetical protein
MRPSKYTHYSLHRVLVHCLARNTFKLSSQYIKALKLLYAALGSTQPLTEMSTWNLPGGKRRPARKADNCTAIFELII